MRNKSFETNKKVRDAIKKSGLMKWELADLMGIHHSTLSVKLRHEMPEEEQLRIIHMIECASEKREIGVLKKEA